MVRACLFCFSVFDVTVLLVYFSLVRCATALYFFLFGSSPLGDLPSLLFVEDVSEKLSILHLGYQYS
jgi:hypothetical protein